jgi:predicted phosphodiesterase
MWTKQKVKFLRPTQEEGRDQFFNILVLHQNRAVGRGRRNAIYESMIPEWFDVVVWGHEHECQTEFEVGLIFFFHNPCMFFNYILYTFMLQICIYGFIFNIL